jgi:hypothetical protein
MPVVAAAISNAAAMTQSERQKPEVQHPIVCQPGNVEMMERENHPIAAK